MPELRVLLQDVMPYQYNVLDRDVTDPSTLTPNKGDRHIVAPSAVGDWSGKDGQIAWYDGSAWQFDVPVEGWETWDVDQNERVYYTDAGAWDVAPDINSLDDVPDGTTYGRVKNTELVGGSGGEGELHRMRVQYGIQAVDDTTETITIDGDQTGKFSDGDSISIFGSTGNDGDYTIDTSGVTYVPSQKQTEITVTGDLTSAVADGHVYNDTTKEYVTSEQAKEAWERRARYDEDLGVLLFSVPDAS